MVAAIECSNGIGTCSGQAIGVRGRQARHDGQPSAPPIMIDVLTTPEARPDSSGASPRFRGIQRLRQF